MFWPWGQALDPIRVAKLVELFRRGEFAMNILRKPGLLEFAKQPKRDGHGAWLICDGKHAIAALQQLRAEFEENKSQAETWDEALVDAITKGVRVSVVEFAEDDPDLVQAFNVAAHDADSNTYKHTSLKDLVGVAMRYKARTPGGDWQKVKNTLDTLYGPGKRTSTAQMLWL